MKKNKTAKLVLILSSLMIVLGAGLLLFSFAQQPSEKSPVKKEISESFRDVKISLTDCVLSVKQAEKNYIEFQGYGESELGILQDEEELVISDSLSFSDRFSLSDSPGGLSGIGRYLKDKNTDQEKRSVTLCLASDPEIERLEILLNNSMLTLEGGYDAVTLIADNSAILCSDFSFRRFDGDLSSCEATFSFSQDKDSFSRDIATYRTEFIHDGMAGMNAEYFFAVKEAPFFTLVTEGGFCCLKYRQQNAQTEKRA